jgi:O-methyltransferase
MSLLQNQFSYSSLLGERAEGVYAWFLKSLHLPGDIAECGVFSGETSRELARYLEDHAISKTLHMFDSFQGFPEVITMKERALATGDELQAGNYFSPLTTVLQNLESLHKYIIHKGRFSETLPVFSEPLCFIHADADLYQSTVDIIHLANRCLIPGGHIVFDDYDNPRFPGINLAIEKYLDPEKYIIVRSPETIQCFVTRR